MRRLEEIQIERIEIHESIRQIFNEEALSALTESIKKHGILQPLVVEPGLYGKFILKIGRRRFEAAKRAGLDHVPVIIREDKLDADTDLATQLVENIHRQKLDPIDEAEAYLTLKNIGTKVSEIARLVGKERTYVSHSMRLLKLHPEIRKMVRQGKISREHALSLLRLEHDQQIDLAEEIVRQDLTLVDTRQRVRELLGKELKYRLVPIRIEPSNFEILSNIAPDGDVEKFLKDTVDRIIKEYDEVLNYTSEEDFPYNKK